MTDEKTRIRILDAIVKHVLKHHINIAGVDYDKWRTSLSEKTGDLLQADELKFEQGVRESLTSLGTSHTGFYHSQPREMLPQHTINATVRAIETEQGERWMFLDVFEDGPAQQAGIRPGYILVAIDDQPCLPPQIPQFGIGRTHSLRIQRRIAHRGFFRSQCPTGRVQSSVLRWSNPKARCSQSQHPVSGC